MRHKLFLIVIVLVFLCMTGCSNSLLVKIRKSQTQYFFNQNTGRVSKNMLKSLHDARKHVFEKEIIQLKNSDTLFFIEGYSITSGYTYSMVWSTNMAPIKYKSHFGRNVELIKESFLLNDVKEKVSQLKFEKLPKDTSVLGGNCYIVTVVFIEDSKIVKITHTLFDEPSF